VLECTAEAQPGAVTHEQARPNDRSPADAQVEPPRRMLRNVRVGYSLSYPRGWHITGQVIATEFAAAARCESVRVVDFAPPASSGPSAEIRHSFVQVCSKRVTDGSSLDEFMRETYGARLSELFGRTTLGATRAYGTKHRGETTTLFLQTPGFRLQIVAAVVAAPSKRALRHSQVARILESFSLMR
jgi:hypothetical protein